MKNMKKYGVPLLVLAVSFFLCYSNALYVIDKMLADPLYQRQSAVSKDIKIIAIDEETIQRYGDPKTWDREIPARLVEILNQDTAPLVLAFDIMYIGAVDETGDEAFAQAARDAGNVITAVNAVRRTELVQQADGGYLADENHIEMVEYPYDALKSGTGYGFANTIQDKDGYIRHAQLKVNYGTEEIDSFAASAYKLYCERTGTQAVMPDTFDEDVFAFTYSGKSGDYEVVSLCDVLDGNVDPKAFANAIVLAGAYAPGMQDAYNVPIQKGTQMYGVEIHANILEALMEGKTAVHISLPVYAILAAILVAVLYIVSGHLKLLPNTILFLGCIAANFAAGKLLYSHGFIMSVAELPLLLLALYGYRIVQGYLLELWKRHKVMNAFKKYVAPQVVEEISKKGDFQIALGGENRHIAVLFVDIRGFTPMSESLEPEQVVEILNEYLSLTTNAIFKNGGTLDKFIGDAAMAVSNAPFDLDDYIYRAVCTAIDIAAGSEELERKLSERFGKSVSFGIGVNCGNAVVGNIGCEFRMDYTAIGDTVNTAARLESNAKRGQILMSEYVYGQVKDRVVANEVGEIPLKGKSKGVFVYELKELRKA